MGSELLLTLYTGSLFALIFLVAPVLLRARENKDLAGGLYGKILWRFYKVAFLLLILYLILGNERLYAVLLMLGLSFNVSISYWLKNYKKSLGNIDQIEYQDPKRVLFRRVSILSTLTLFGNFLLSFYILINQLKEV
ncbi:MAG: hypothetical protein ACK4VK_01265 [Aquificaceae bacterium]